MASVSMQLHRSEHTYMPHSPHPCHTHTAHTHVTHMHTYTPHTHMSYTLTCHTHTSTFTHTAHSDATHTLPTHAPYSLTDTKLAGSGPEDASPTEAHPVQGAQPETQQADSRSPFLQKLHFPLHSPSCFPPLPTQAASKRNRLHLAQLPRRPGSSRRTM